MWINKSVDKIKFPPKNEGKPWSGELILVNKHNARRIIEKFSKNCRNIKRTLINWIHARVVVVVSHNFHLSTKIGKCVFLELF